MTWLQRIFPWLRGRRPAPAAPCNDLDEATRAVREANRKLDEARLRRSEVDEVAESLRFHRHENHFAELFRESFGRPR